jgi:hypothetical protein
MAAVASIACDEGRYTPLPTAASEDDAIVEQASGLARGNVTARPYPRGDFDPFPAIMLDLFEDGPCPQSRPDRRSNLRAGANDGAGKRNPGRETIIVVTRDEHCRHHPVFTTGAVKRLGASKPKCLVQLFPETRTVTGRPGPSLSEGLLPETASEADPDIIRHQSRQSFVIAGRNRFLKLATNAAESGIAATKFDRRQGLRRCGSEGERGREH